MSRTKSWIISAVCFAFVFVFSGALAVAGEDAAAPAAAAPAAAAPAKAAAEKASSAASQEAEKAIPSGPLEMIKASGIFGYIICLMSVIAVALVIENLLTLKRDKLLPEDLLADIEGALDSGNYEEAMEICEAEDCMLTRIISAGLSKMPLGVARMEDAIGEESDAQATMLNQKLGYINLIAAIAPMMGLLGTVFGMIDAFGMIASNPQSNASDLAAGIYVALMTTLLGLVVAIPSTVAFTFFRGRVVKILMVMSIVNGEIVDRFRGSAGEEEYYEE